MQKEENLRVERNQSLNKASYKIMLYVLKVLPIGIAMICILNIILSYFDLDTRYLNYIGGVSLLPLVFLYITSYVFEFCIYHRIFLHYIVLNNILCTLDHYCKFNTTDKEYLMLHLIILGIILLIILKIYLNDRNSKRSAINYNK